jgi:hypothetical protein
MALDAGTSVAGTFTQSACASAPVDWCKAHLSGGQARALLVNSGNANAFTGMKGRQSVERSADIVAESLAGLGRTGFPRLHRGDRRASDSGEICWRDDGSRWGSRRWLGPLGECGARHYDHRHLSQGRIASGDGRTARRSRSAASRRVPE